MPFVRFGADWDFVRDKPRSAATMDGMSGPHPTSLKRRVWFWSVTILLAGVAGAFLSPLNHSVIRSRDSAADVTIGYVKPNDPNAIWIELHGGRPFSGHLLSDVAAFVAQELAKHPGRTIVITPGSDDTYGTVTNVVQECRKARAKHIVVSIFPPDPW